MTSRSDDPHSIVCWWPKAFANGDMRHVTPSDAAEGVLLQMDDSPNDWLQGRGPRLCLMGAIDDATSKAMELEFRPTEDQAGYLRLLRHITLTYGVPGCIYHDKHIILRSPKETTLEDELAGRPQQSQVQRVMDWLGIEWNTRSCRRAFPNARPRRSKRLRL